jgi:hypothetical protein
MLYSDIQSYHRLYIYGKLQISINTDVTVKATILYLNSNYIDGHKGTLIYNLVFKSFDCIYSLASAHPKGLIELKAQWHTTYIQFDSVSYFSS